MRSLLIALTVIAACAAPPAAADADRMLAAGGEHIDAAGALAVPRASHSATLLPDGAVLIAGGYDGACGIATTELFEPASGKTLPGPKLTVPRCSHSATALADGRVLLAGGWSGADVVASAELYDPRTLTFTPAAPMKDARAAHVAVTLADGRVLVAGGSDGSGMMADAELYDSATGAWTRTGSLGIPRVAATAVRLADGTVLVAGGSPRRGEVVATAELFDPAAGTFAATGPLTIARHKHAATLLPDGNVLVVGGSDARDGRGQYSASEIYDARARTFSATADMRAPRFKLPDAVATLTGGEVLVAGGGVQAEVFDPVKRTFRVVAGSLGARRSFSTATVLRDGRVLVAGGYDENIRVSGALFLYRR